jgi:hypothetical protein
MTTPRRQALALAGVLAATTLTGGALVTVLSSRSAATPPAVHVVHAVAAVQASPPAVAPTGWREVERGDA